MAQDVLEKRLGIGVQWLFFGGGLFMMGGFWLSSISYTLFGVLFGAVLMGLGLGFGGFMAGGICVLWFEQARGTMLMLAMSGQVSIISVQVFMSVQKFKLLIVITFFVLPGNWKFFLLMVNSYAIRIL